MTYEAAAQATFEGVPGFCERRSRYRPRDHYAEVDAPDGPHPVSAAAERLVFSGAGRARFRRILALSELIAASDLPASARTAWLELEALLHAHWLAVAREHYNLGVDTGLLRALDPGALGSLPPRERVLALCDALRKTVDQL
jgi:hypothetical protein